jgi:glycine betaine transporter
LTWGAFQCIIAAVLLHSDGLKGLQKASIVAALPFAVLMLIMMASLVKALRADLAAAPRAERTREEEALTSSR